MTVRERIARERSRIRRLSLLAAGGVALAALGVLLAVGVLVLGGARWMTLPAATPFLIWAAALLAAGGAAVVMARRLRREASVAAIARAVEEERALRRGSLLGVLELGGANALARAAEARLSGALGGLPGPLAPSLQRRVARRGAAGFAAFGVGAILLAGVGSRSPDGLGALLHPMRAARGTLLPPIELVDVPPSVLRGESLAITVRAPGRRTVTVARRATGAGWEETTHPVGDDGLARVRFAGVDADLLLAARDGRSASDTVAVRVTDRPFLGDLVVHAEYPAYLRRPPETLPAGELLRVPRGAVLRLTASASTELHRVWLVDEAGDTLALAADGRRATGRLTAQRSGRWTWGALSRAGALADLPPALELDVIPDSAPQVEIVVPARDTLVFPSDVVRLTIRASDDHGLGTVVLRSWPRRRSGGVGAATSEEVAVDGVRDWMGDAELPLAARGLEPGDALHVVAVAVDASPWRQAAESRELVLRVPLPDEQRAAVRDAADSAVARASALAAAQRALAQRTEVAARSRDRSTAGSQGSQGQQRAASGGLSYEGAERARQLANEQRELQRRAREAAAAAEQLERQLRDAGALDSALQEQLREAQRLMQEALSPELQRQLAELEQAAQGLDEQQVREAMAKLAEQQRQLREQLARSAEMLRRAALEGAMETLRDEARELAEQQQALADSLQRGSGEGRARQAAEVERRTERLARDVERLEERLRSERAEQGASEVAQARPHAEASREAMRQAAREAGARQPSLDARQARTGERADSGTASPEERRAAEPRAEVASGTTRHQGAGQQGSQERGTQRQEGSAPRGERGGSNATPSPEAARQAGAAAEHMGQTAERLARARQAQVDAWKQELSAQLDQAVSEMMQLAREQRALEEAARSGQADASEVRAQQNAIRQGVERANERVAQAGQASSHVSQGTQRAMAEARQQVERAARAAAENASQGTGSGGGSPQQLASAMGDATQALTRAAASLVRDRERVNAAGSASGFSEMIQAMRELAQRQGSLNAQTSGLLPGAGRRPGQGARDAARRLAEQQREVARELDALGDRDASGRADEMAREARQLANALEMGALDPSVAERQQRLFRRMLDAGRTLEREEREDTGRREGETATTRTTFLPPGTATEGRAAREFRVPDWNELRDLSAEERRLVLEYFRRLNAERAGGDRP